MENNPTLDSRNKKEIFSEGKTKTLYYYKDPKLPYRDMVRINTKDNLTAFDGGKVVGATVAKQKTHQTCNVFRYLSDHNVPTSFIRQLDDFNFVSRTCTMLPYEIVVRRHAWGSYLKRYPVVEPGVRFEETVVEFFHKLSVIPIVTSHKDPNAIMPNVRMMEESIARNYYMRDGKWIVDVETDPLIIFNYDEWKKVIADQDKKERFKLDLYSAKKPFDIRDRLHQIDASMSPRETNIMFVLARQVFHLLEEAWAKLNVTLVDLKVEIGMDYNTGDLIVADVIDNDSWRIWPNGDQSQQLDKQSFRDGENIAEVESKYKQVTKYTELFG